VVTQPSRRAFLTGRRTPPTPWGQFCGRLSRTCVGAVRWDQDPESRRAWLEPGRDLDVLHAHALCREFGVRFLLFDSEAFAETDQAVLWVDSRATWAQLELVQPDQQIWRVDAGVRIQTLRQRGVDVLVDMSEDTPSDWTVAQWFASVSATRQRPGGVAAEGIVQAQLLLADGTLERLGPFGAAASAPLKSLAVQQMIPKLFELAQSGEASVCARQSVWPSRYRLDAVMHQFGDSPNLACLFKGHGGSLAWLQTLWLGPPVVLQNTALTDEVVVSQSAQLDHAIKQTLDPTGVFGEIPAAKGLESGQVHLI